TSICISLNFALSVQNVAEENCLLLSLYHFIFRTHPYYNRDPSDKQEKNPTCHFPVVLCLLTMKYGHVRKIGDACFLPVSLERNYFSLQFPLLSNIVYATWMLCHLPQ